MYTTRQSVKNNNIMQILDTIDICETEKENIRNNTTSLNNHITPEVALSGGGRSNITLESSTSLSASVVILRRHRFATLSCISGSNVNNGEDGDINVENNNQFVVNRQRPFLCRTPPPNYHSLPATPPPSYATQQPLHNLPQNYQEQEQRQTQRLPENSRVYNVNNEEQQEQSAHQLRQQIITQNQQGQQQQQQQQQLQQFQPLRNCQVPEALFVENHEEHGALNRLNFQRNGINEPVVANRQQLQQQPRLANGRCANRNVATVSQRNQHQQQQQPQQQQQRHHYQQQIQQRRRKQRRRKLHLLQQQQHILNLGNQFTDTNSSLSLTDASESDNDIICIGSNRDQRRRRRQRLLKLRDAYCPDLLNACSLILLQQQTSDSTVGSFTDTPPPPQEDNFNDSTDYVEIQEFYTANNRQQNAEQNKTQSLSQIYEQINQRENDTYTSPDNNRLNGAGVVGGEQAEREDAENQRLYFKNKQEMGQNLSIRRPRISLTWVLREQSQTQQQQQQQQQNETQPTNKKQEEQIVPKEKKENITDLNNVLNNNQIVNSRQEKKKYRLKHIPQNTEPLNGYATTPTGYTNTPTALGSQKFFSNQNLLEYHKDEANCKPASKDLLFVCTPQRVPESFGGSSMDVLALAKKRNEIRKKLASKMAQFRSENQTPRLANNISTDVQLKKDAKSSLKSGSYSEPSLIAASEGNSRRHRHRKRRERNRSQKFGYEIKNVDEFLNKCSLASPGNIPMVLSTSCILYQTRPGGYQTELTLPLGMVVNAVFKNQNWLYVQTPHAEEGYVNYNTCLPLGILPPEARKETNCHTKPTPCWETNRDIFPKPCGNMTDSEKEIHLRVGSRSEGARTPHLKNATTDNDTATVISVKTENTDCINGNANSSVYGEQHVDKLYLRAASQPKLNEKTSYAQLKIIRNHSSVKSQTSAHTNNDEYVTLQQKQQQQKQPHQIKQKHIHTNQPIQKTYVTRTFITNGHNGQHLHPKDMKTNLQQQQKQQQQQLLLQTTNCKLKTSNSSTMLQQQQQQQNNTSTTITVTTFPLNKNQLQTSQQHQQLQQQQQQQNQSQSLLQNNLQLQQHQQQQQQHTLVAPRTVLNAIRRSTAHCGQRQTLVAITTDYTTDALTLNKGDIVTLCECRETKDHRQWFYVRTRDGRQGYIPAEVAGHGYL